MEKSKLIGGLIAVTVLAFIGSYFYLNGGVKNQQVNTPQSQPKDFNEVKDYQEGNPRISEIPENLKGTYKEPQLFEVNITKDGFNPANLEIARGDIVNFINKDEIERRVVGESGLWESPDLAKDGFYSQGFDVPGTYGYKDFKSPETKGVVVVK